MLNGASCGKAISGDVRRFRIRDRKGTVALQEE